MPLEPQWRDLVKVFLITIILGAVIYVVQWVLWTTVGLWAWSWIGWLNLITVIVFLVLIYQWAKKYKFI